MAISVKVTTEDVKADKESRVFKPQPTGWYNFEVTDADLKEFKSANEKGKPNYRVTLRVIDGDYAGRKQFVNVPLFLKWNNEKKSSTNFINFFSSLSDESGEALYDLDGDFEVPEGGELFGHRVTARVVVKDDEYRDEQEGLPKGTSKKNEVSSFRLYDPNDDPSPSKEDAEEAAPAAKSKARGGKSSLDL